MTFFRRITLIIVLLSGQCNALELRQLVGSWKSESVEALFLYPSPYSSSLLPVNVALYFINEDCGRFLTHTRMENEWFIFEDKQHVSFSKDTVYGEAKANTIRDCIGNAIFRLRYENDRVIFQVLDSEHHSHRVGDLSKADRSASLNLYATRGHSQFLRNGGAQTAPRKSKRELAKLNKENKPAKPFQKPRAYIIDENGNKVEIEGWYENQIAKANRDYAALIKRNNELYGPSPQVQQKKEWKPSKEAVAFVEGISYIFKKDAERKNQKADNMSLYAKQLESNPKRCKSLAKNARVAKCDAAFTCESASSCFNTVDCDLPFIVQQACMIRLSYHNLFSQGLWYCDIKNPSNVGRTVDSVVERICDQ